MPNRFDVDIKVLKDLSGRQPPRYGTPLNTVARGPVPRDRHHYEVRLRSFRTYMSIEKRVVTLSRSLNLFTSTKAIDIKVLKDLRDVFPQRGQWRGTGPRPTVKGGGLAYRSAGACPPRSPRTRDTPASPPNYFVLDKFISIRYPIKSSRPKTDGMYLIFFTRRVYGIF